MLSKILAVVIKCVAIAPSIISDASSVEKKVTSNEPLQQKVSDAADGFIQALDEVLKTL